MRFGPRSLTPWTWKGANPTMSGHLVRRGLQPLAWAVPFLLGFVLLGPAATSARAQTGTITGKITDEKGDPAPFIAVGLNGTQMGAQSNMEGKFTIIKVPVGTYTMAIRTRSKAAPDKQVQVDLNHTTTVDFQVTDKAIAIKGIEVISNAKITIRKKDSSTKQIVTAEDLHSLPVDNYKEAIGLKAGVISQGGELHFRGGRGDEVLTIVNGIASRNPLRAEGVDLGLLAVSSSEQVLGGLDAQYGNALSGVINLTTREGGDKFGGEIRYFTDRYGEADKSFNNFERLSTGFGGPFLFPKTNYFISFEGTYTDTYLRNTATHQEHRFLNFIRLGNRQSNSAKLSSKLTFKLTPNEKLNFEIIKNRSLDGEFQNRWNRQGFVHVIQDSTAPTDGTITARYGAWSYFQVDSSYIPMNTAEHLPVTDEDYLQTAVTWKHTLGVGTIYNLRASRQEWQTTTDVLDRMPWENVGGRLPFLPARAQVIDRPDAQRVLPRHRRLEVILVGHRKVLRRIHRDVARIHLEIGPGSVARRDGAVGGRRRILNHVDKPLPVPPVLEFSVQAPVLDDLEVQFLVRGQLERQLARELRAVGLPIPEPDEIQESMLPV